tara:strand:- start:4053 stop:5600 length:1548 start_codon:yes stop_codon:yes gene_type:complete
MAIAVSAMATGLIASPSEAQEGCEAVAPGNDLTRALTVGELRITYITNPHFLCAGGVEIWADSAEAFPDRGYSHLIGNVRYQEDARELRADDARYFTNEGRLQAEGSLVIVDEAQGSSIENGNLVYLLETDFRDVSEMTVLADENGVRPVAVLTPRQEDEPGAENNAYTVVGDRIFLLGASYFTAVGDVRIEQDSLEAFADSAEYDMDGSGLVLEGDARVLSGEYDLVGRRITLSAPDAPEDLIHAKRNAKLEGGDLLLTSAQIFLFLENDQLERLVATPIVDPASAVADLEDRERPEAAVEDFVLTADSVEVRAPAQRVERVFASGSARSESRAADSLTVDLLPEIARTDWLEGDTVILNFTEKEGVPSDQGRETGAPELELEDIIAIGSARSLYRLPPNDSLAVPGVDPPAVHYVVGNEIRIEMVGQQVKSMQVSGQTEGVHLEPLQRASGPDTTQVDTLAVPDSSSFESKLDSELMGTQNILDYVPPSKSSQSREPFVYPLQNRPRSLPWIR